MLYEKKYFENYSLHQYEDITSKKYDFVDSYAVNARYIKQKEASWMNNPLIEALPPPIYSYEELTKLIFNAPTYDFGERDKDSNSRYEACTRLDSAYIPLDIYLQVYYRFDLCLRMGYRGKNYFDKEYYEMLRINKTKCDKSISRKFNNSDKLPQKQGFSILGISYCGKTSLMNRILQLYPQVIIHDDRGLFNQIVWLKVDCPASTSPKSLCLNTLGAIDALLDTNYRKSLIERRANTEIVMDELRDALFRHRVGILIIDEIQFLKKGDDETRKILNFFVNLNNISGIPIIYIGNYDAYPMLCSTLKLTKRTMGKGLIKFEPLPINEFAKYLKVLWKYQWTSANNSITDEVVYEFYKQTAGIPGYAKDIYEAVQQEVIGKKELITVEVINKVCKRDFEPYSNYAKAILSDNEKDYAKYPEILQYKILHLVTTIKMKKQENQVGNLGQIRTIEEIKKEVEDYLVSEGIDSITLKSYNIESLVYENLSENNEFIVSKISAQLLQNIAKVEETASKKVLNAMLRGLDQDIVKK
jgi:hypothetical protein